MPQSQTGPAGLAAEESTAEPGTQPLERSGAVCPERSPAGLLILRLLPAGICCLTRAPSIRGPRGREGLVSVQPERHLQRSMQNTPEFMLQCLVPCE